MNVMKPAAKDVLSHPIIRTFVDVNVAIIYHQI